MISHQFKKFTLWMPVKAIASIFLALLVVACGGGEKGATNVPALVLSLTDSGGASVNMLVAGTSYTLKATVSQTGGAAVNEVVTFSAGSLGTLSPSSGTALTNSLGVATITFVPTAAGAATASASATVNKITTIAATTTTPASSTTTRVPVTGDLNYGVTSASTGGSGTATLSLSLVDAGNNAVSSMTIGTNYRLVATATDTNGLASNAIVSFSPSSAASLIPATGTALTNGSGVAQIVLVPGTAGAATASASFVATTGTVTKSVNFTITPTPTTTLAALVPASTSVTSGGTTTLTVNTLVNQALTAGVSTLFSTTCGQITSTNPVVSNSSGVATATYSSTTAGGLLCTGATTVQASAGGSNAFASLTVASPVITLTGFAASPSSIASAANSALSLTVLSNGAVPTSAVSVALTATCGQVSPSIATTNGSGVIGATYRSVKSDGTLCLGADTIAATTTGATASTTITVAAPTTGSISFVSASPAQIFLSNSGAASTTTLSFKSLFSTGAVAPSTSVKFTLTGNPGGVTFGTAGNTAPYTVTSDSAGVSTVLVYAGNVPGAITITAEWTSNSAVTTNSNGLTAASGAARQSSMSLSPSKFNIDGWDGDGDTTVLTARVADSNGNPVPDGTVINFVSSGGQISRSCSTTTANTGGLNAAGFSQCSVTLMAQNPRPANGRVVVLAYLEGVKNFTDVNGNGTYDAGIDMLVDQGDAYRDDNENGLYDSSLGEFLISKGGALTCAGGGGTAPKRVNTCTGLLPTTVRAQTTILFAASGTSPLFTRLTNTPFNTPAPATFRFYLNGVGTTGNLLPLPVGTTVSVRVLTPASGCTASDLTPTTVPNTNPTTDPSTNVGAAYPFSVTLTGTSTVNCSGAVLQVTTASPVSGVGWQLSNPSTSSATSTVVP